MAWGDADDGGDSSKVQTQLKNVQQIQASDGNFAAVMGDGSVVTWGGASGAVQDQLQFVAAAVQQDTTSKC